MSKRTNSDVKMTSASKSEARTKLNEFYAVAKENLLKMKQELEDAQANYNRQLEVYQELALAYHDIKLIADKKEVELKGADERKIIYEKYKSNLEKKIKDMENEANVTGKEIERIELSTSDKVNKVKQNEELIKHVKENQIGEFNERIQQEKDKNSALRSKIKEVEDKINEYQETLAELQMTDGRKGELMMKDTADMNKFLADL